jgi:hypothetical protein
LKCDWTSDASSLAQAKERPEIIRVSPTAQGFRVKLRFYPAILSGACPNNFGLQGAITALSITLFGRRVAPYFNSKKTFTKDVI